MPATPGTTTAALARTGSPAKAVPRPAAGRVGWFADLIRAEWIKFRSTRSTYFTILGTVVIAIGVGALVAHNDDANWPTMPAIYRAGVDPIDVAFRGFPVAQLTIGALGVLMISSEYACGLIRTTFGAAPQRRAVLGAKAVVIGAAALVIGEITAFAGFLLSQGLLSSTGKGLSITDSGVLSEVASAGMYLAVVALLGLALGVLVRHTAGGISALFLLVFLAPNVVSGLPGPWNARIGEWLPPNLAQQLIDLHPSAELLSRPWSLVVLLAYPVVFLTAAAWRLTRSDA